MLNQEILTSDTKSCGLKTTNTSKVLVSSNVLGIWSAWNSKENHEFPEHLSDPESIGPMLCLLCFRNCSTQGSPQKVDIFLQHQLYILLPLRPHSQCHANTNNSLPAPSRCSELWLLEKGSVVLLKQWLSTAEGPSVRWEMDTGVAQREERMVLCDCYVTELRCSSVSLQAAEYSLKPMFKPEWGSK